MKKIYSIAIIASMLLSGISANAQGTVELSKKVKDNQNGTYTLTLESYVTGEEIKQPLDIILLLDNSRSMYEYNVGTTDTKRSTALKNAVNTFLQSLYYNSNGLQHQVSIIKFQGGGRRIYSYLNIDNNNLRANDICGKWIQMNDTDITAAKTAVTNMKSPWDETPKDTGTPAADGFRLAQSKLSEVADNGREKVIIFFTDGCCGTGETWNAQSGNYNGQTSAQDADWGYDNGTEIPNRYYAPYVVAEANKCKEDATIFCVGTFGSFDNNGQKGDTYFYLRHISSDYTSEIHVSGTVPETPKTGHITNEQHPTPGDKEDAYNKNFVSVDSGDRELTIGDNEKIFDANNTTALTDAFNSILVTITNAPDLGSNSAVVLDALTNMFKLPAGTLTDPANQIRLYTCDAQKTTSLKWATTGGDVTVHKDSNNNIIETGGTTESWKIWKPWGTGDYTDYLRINPTSPVSGEDSGSDIIEVTGYDFKGNWVGPRIGGNYGGQKLIIQFEILPDPSNTGGVIDMFTNDPSSGIYAYNSKTGGYENTGKFEEPDVKLPYLKIIKNGLGTKQSAIFKVTKVKGSNDSTADDVTPFSTMVVISGNTNPEAIVKLIYTGYYLVEEKSWSWEFQSTVVKDKSGTSHTGNSLIQQLSTVTAETYDENGYLVYEFTNNNEKTTPNHAESYIMNKMFVNTYPTTD